MATEFGNGMIVDGGVCAGAGDVGGGTGAGAGDEGEGRLGVADVDGGRVSIDRPTIALTPAATATDTATIVVAARIATRDRASCLIPASSPSPAYQAELGRPVLRPVPCEPATAPP